MERKGITLEDWFHAEYKLPRDVNVFSLIKEAIRMASCDMPEELAKNKDSIIRALIQQKPTGSDDEDDLEEEDDDLKAKSVNGDCHVHHPSCGTELKNHQQPPPPAASKRRLIIRIPLKRKQVPATTADMKKMSDDPTSSEQPAKTVVQSMSEARISRISQNDRFSEGSKRKMSEDPCLEKPAKVEVQSEARISRTSQSDRFADGIKRKMSEDPSSEQPAKMVAQIKSEARISRTSQTDRFSGESKKRGQDNNGDLDYDRFFQESMKRVLDKYQNIADKRRKSQVLDPKDCPPANKRSRGAAADEGGAKKQKSGTVKQRICSRLFRQQHKFRPICA